MSQADPPSVHPTAVVSPEAELAEGVQVGPFAILEGRVRLGPGCIVRPHAHLIGPLTMGQGNVVCTGAVLGERPQHLKYNDEPTGLEIGDFNIFREHVTVHRGTVHSWLTRIGSHNFFMVNSHVGHDSTIGNRCIITNGALIGGHCILEDNVYLSGNAAVHQFNRLGRLCMISGCSATTKDVPPFIVQQGINIVVGINVIGMRRAGMTSPQVDGVRRAYRFLFREGLPLPAAMARIERDLGHIDAVQEMLTFLRHCPHGVNSTRDKGRHEAA
jgi:UDP-N-acetylglucosamine acyltransferase